MKFLRADAPIFSIDRFADWAEAHSGLRGKITPLYSERDQNMRLVEANGDTWVLKLASAEEDPAIIDCQIETLRHIERVDPTLPIPKVRTTRDGKTTTTQIGADGKAHVFYVLSYLAGEIADNLPMAPDLPRKTGALVARLGRAMRGLSHPAACRRELLWDHRMAPRLAQHVEKLASAEQRALGREVMAHLTDEALPRLARLRAQLIHGDVHGHNMLVDPAEPGKITGVIDFGDMLHGPLVFDVANPIGDFLRDPKKILEIATGIVAGYHAVTPLEPEEIELVFDLVRARLLVASIISRFRTVETPDEPNYIEGYESVGLELLAEMNRIGRTVFTEHLRNVVGIGIGTESRAGEIPAIGDLVARRKRAMGSRLYVFYDPPLHMVRGEGVWLIDATGRRFLDCYNNVPHVGHCHPHVVEAITRQVRTLNTNTRYLGEQVLEYAERLGASLAGELKVCAFVNSGSEANDIAWRMAKAYTGNRGGLTQEFAYHGITDAVDAFSPAGSLTGTIAPHMRTLLAPDGYRGIHRYGTPDLGPRYAADADRAIASLAEAGLKPAAFILDSAFLTNGVLEPQPGYVSEVFAKVRHAGGLCIADEVQSGFGRMGQYLWGHTHHGVVPDIVTLGKPAGNGHPLGVVITRPDIMDCFLRETAFFSTFGGNNVSCAAGLAVLDVIESEGLIENATATGAYLKAGLRNLMAKHDIIGDVRGTGLAIGIELVTDRKSLAPAKNETTRLLNLMRDEGVLIGSEGLLGNILKIRPPIVFTMQNADQMIGALDRALARL